MTPLLPADFRSAGVCKLICAIHHKPLPPTTGVGVTGQKRQQVASLLDFDLVHLMGLDDLNVSYGVGQRLP